MALARRGRMEVNTPNVIWLDFDFKCGQVDLSQRLEEKLTSPNVEKNRRKSISNWLGQYEACPSALTSWLLTLTAKLLIVGRVTGCMEMNSGRNNADMIRWTELLRDECYRLLFATVLLLDKCSKRTVTQWVTLTFAERLRLVFSLSGFANLSTKITTKREFRLSSAERKHLAIPLSESD